MMNERTYTHRGPNIPGSIRKLIARIYVENTGQSANQVMTELHKQMEKKGRQDWPPNWPGISAVQKELEKFRKNHKGVDDEDKPWGCIALASYPLPPDTLPVVYRVWASALLNGKPLTIRQAKWVSLLSHIYVGKYEKCNINDDVMEALRSTACQAAAQEKVLKLTGGLPSRHSDMTWYWLEDARLYYVLTGDVLPVNVISDGR